MSNTLRPSQQIAHDEICNYIALGEKRIVLQGSAGTGKTYLVDELITSLKSGALYSWGVIYVCAPTGKALNVVRQKITPRSYVEFRTIHSGLKLKQKKNYHTGEITFELDKYVNPKDPPLKNAQIVILDESSMVGSNLMFGKGKIEEYPDIVFIFVGDFKQLPPIGEDISPIFTQGFATVEITEPIRQSVGSPILDLSYNLNLLKSRVNNINENQEGYFFETNRPRIIEKLAEINGTDQLKYLSWTNDAADAINLAVRRKIYGDPRKIELGESLIFDEPYFGLAENYTTSQEILVESLTTETRRLRVPNEYTTITYKNGGVPEIKEKYAEDKITVIPTYDIMTVKLYFVNNDFHVLHEDSEAEVKSVCTAMKAKCDMKLQSYPGYYWFVERSAFAQMKYNHALTVHKSQGSTFETVIVDVPNIGFNKKKPKEMEAMYYTAITRASKLVALFS